MSRGVILTVYSFTFILSWLRKTSEWSKFGFDFFIYFFGRMIYCNLLNFYYCQNYIRILFLSFSLCIETYQFRHKPFIRRYLHFFVKIFPYLLLFLCSTKQRWLWYNGKPPHKKSLPGNSENQTGDLVISSYDHYSMKLLNTITHKNKSETIYVMRILFACSDYCNPRDSSFISLLQITAETWITVASKSIF